MKCNYIAKTFNELTTKELYEILVLRTEVFVVEQNCPYQECDGKDYYAIHFMGYIENELVAYARILPKNVSYNTPSIGRVVTKHSIRGKGLGYKLMTNAVEECYNRYGEIPITISAQAHLQPYYNKIGFNSVGDTYLEDNIPHIKMIKK